MAGKQKGVGGQWPSTPFLRRNVFTRQPGGDSVFGSGKLLTDDAAIARG
jgi:hypothetical protein